MERLQCAAHGLQTCHDVSSPRVLHLPGASPEQPHPFNLAVLNGLSVCTLVRKIWQVLLTSLCLLPSYQLPQSKISRGLSKMELFLYILFLNLLD